ncbi:TRAP transporter, DctM subunit [Thalassovita litoralis]|jgi:tripartite ATP-independent transporter DctM subunit|uniref:TRAP transporter large permease protein n=1 Tax=Thalassovita litoralis TaxID=1010611 RepID=A0A521C0P8_9RHOB|nr:TRAP transporter large permease subunit [Thalassovita litoralis]SMO52958.1 TRAP transporter, DctM subunit [Thalassovita litoralis]
MIELISASLPGAMFLSLVVALFSGAPVAIMLMGISLVFGLLAVWTGDMRLVHATLLPNRIFSGTIENPVLVAAPMFIFMGLLMEKTRIAEDLLLTLQRLMRVIPGGLALAVVLMGTILAAATGIIGASVVMLTALAIPTMVERGYNKGLAAGTVASAGTLGILIPPSVMLVFMGDLLSISLGHLFVAALLPGLLLSLAYVLYIVLRSAAQPSIAPKAPPLTADEKQGLWLESLKSVLAPLVMIVAVLGSILGGVATPTEASGVGVFAVLLLGALRGRLNRATLNESMDGSVKTLGMLFFIFVGATAFSYIFRKVGGEHFIVETASALPFGNWGLLLTMMVMIFVMGFFFDWIEITLIMLPIFAPIVQTMDLGDHVARSEMIYWFAILVSLNLQTSFLTPPFGFALFYLKGAAGHLLSMRDIYLGIIPFVLLQIVILGAAMLWPDLVLWLPRMVFE